MCLPDLHPCATWVPFKAADALDKYSKMCHQKRGFSGQSLPFCLDKFAIIRFIVDLPLCIRPLSKKGYTNYQSKREELVRIITISYKKNLCMLEIQKC
jgi:hypothetical protein